MYTIRKLLICFAVLAVLICIWFWITACIHAERARIARLDTRGRIAPRSEWPEALLEVLRDADQRHILVEQLEVYHGFHDDYFWKSDASPELLNFMIVRWKLTLVNRNHNVVRLVFERMPSALSSLSQDSDIDYYVSAEYLPGGEWKGHLYCVMNDKTQKQVVVRYYYNF